ncbi:hypothetical protein ACFLYU_02040 [Candidatus Dependentiae bacterium]
MKKINIYLLLTISLVVYPYTSFCMKKREKITIELGMNDMEIQSAINLAPNIKEIKINKKFKQKITSIKGVQKKGNFLIVEFGDSTAKLINLKNNKIVVEIKEKFHISQFSSCSNFLLIRCDHYNMLMDLRNETSKEKHNFKYDQSSNSLSIKLDDNSTKLIKLKKEKYENLKIGKRAKRLQLNNKSSLLVQPREFTLKLTILNNNVPVKVFKNVLDFEISNDKMLLLVKYVKYRKKNPVLINLKNNKAIIYFNKNIVSGLTNNTVWFQQFNNRRLRLFKLLKQNKETKEYKQKLKIAQKESKLYDVIIKTKYS